ncbi:MAG: sugar-binding protein [Oscillospiraceae bacterium]|nr:sugar-binding protein [Oscillospiraceae bacterium]MCL2278660.1 sugar-binding protein [Oscillospiraceae bacterium]
MKKIIAILLVVTLIAGLTLSLTACDNNGGGDAGHVGIAMPTQSSPRWISDGNSLQDQLRERGFETILQFGEDVVADQISQIESMIVAGVDILVIASIDGSALGPVLELAAAEGITVIAYDRLIMDTPNVSYYVTFDNFAVGVMQANSLLMGLGVAPFGNATGPFNIELFGGSPDDNNAFLFYEGAMSVLDPLIANGTLVVRSGEMGMDIVGTLGWRAEGAQARMENLLVTHYTDARVDAVLSPYDGLSLGIIAALRGAGYGTDAQPWPIVSGQDATQAGIQAIINGELFATVFKDTRDLAAAAVEMIEAILAGGTVPVNDTTTYDNNVFIVPSYLLDIVHVDATNWRAEIIDTDYHSIDVFVIP